nr:PREDICTED: nose resistant to fluoxetine protein 6-like [Bemisia tabaci]
MLGSNRWSKRPKPSFVAVLTIFIVVLFTHVAGKKTSSSLTSPSVHNHAATRNSEQNANQSGRKLSWISHVLSEKLSNFRPRSRTNHLCNQQSDLYEESLRNFTLWAVQMKEASTSAESLPGMLVGQRFHIGHYDECIAIRTSAVAGRFCLANIKFWPTQEVYPEFYTDPLESLEASPDSNAWDNFKVSKKWFRLDRNDLIWSLCVPASCSRQDVEESLNATFADVETKHGIIVKIQMHNNVCTSSIDEAPLPTETKALLYVLIFLSIFCFMATLYHLASWNIIHILDDKGFLLHKILMGFSMTKNFDSLTGAANKGKNMNILDSLKFYSAVQVMVKHRMITLLVVLLYNPSFHETMMKTDELIFVPTLIVDTFFVVSGFLTFVICYEPLKKYGLKIFPLMVFDRWLRLMPAYVTFIAMTIFIFPYMSSGPAWKFITEPIADSCRREWWINLLGVNNQVTPVEPFDFVPPCGPHTWYLACDLQLFPVGLLIVYMFTRNHSSGLRFGLAALAMTVAIPFYVIYKNRYDAVGIADPRRYVEGFNITHFFWVYVKAYMRAGPYVLSILSAFLLMKIRENRWTLSVAWRWVILLAAIVIGQGSQYYGAVFYDKTRQYDVIENALFGALHRTLWSLIICSLIVIQQAWGFGGKIDELLTHQIYVPLGRLTYLVYLFHPVWQMTTMASGRTILYVSVWQLIWLLAGDTMVVFMGSLWLYFIIEAPANKFRAAMMSKLTGKGQPAVKEEQQATKKLD